MSDLASHLADSQAAGEAYLDSVMEEHQDASRQLMPPVDTVGTPDPTEFNNSQHPENALSTESNDSQHFQNTFFTQAVDALSEPQ